jgi:autotransporter-associated beta strand protein
MKNQILPACALLAISYFPAASVHADDFYWGTDTANAIWQDAAHWYADAAGTDPADVAPGASDDAIFSITSLNGTTVSPILNAHTSVNSLTFNNTVGLVMTGTSGNKNLLVGSGGITIGGSGTSVTLGTSAANKNIFVKIQESQTWTNNSAGTLNIRNSSQASDTAAGAVVLTLNAAGSGNITNSGAFSDGAAGSLGLIIDSTGSGIVQAGGGSYTGGTLIRRGIFQTNGASAGTQAVQLGDVSGNQNATFRVNTAAAITTSLVVQAGNTGTNSLEFVRENVGDFSADITLNNTLYVGVRGSEAVQIDGTISGSGDLIKSQYQGGNSGTLLLTNVNTHSGDTLVADGVLTLAETGALTFYIGADGVTNSLGGTGTLNLDGYFIFDLSGAVAGDGNSWQIVDVASLTETFGATFSVQGFANSGGVWTNGGYSFDQSTGLLTYAVPEPSTGLLLAGGLLVTTVFRRRAARRS